MWVSRDILLETQKELETNGFQSAVSLLCVKGLNPKDAHQMVTGLETTPGGPDQHFVEVLASLLPQQKEEASHLLAQYFDISPSFCDQKLVLLCQSGDFSKSNLHHFLRHFRPIHVKDALQHQPQAISSFTNTIYQFLADNQTLKAAQFIKDQLICSDEEVDGIIERLSKDIRRED